MSKKTAPQSKDELKQMIQDWIGWTDSNNAEAQTVDTSKRTPQRNHGHPNEWDVRSVIN